MRKRIFWSIALVVLLVSTAVLATAFDPNNFRQLLGKNINDKDLKTVMNSFTGVTIEDYKGNKLHKYFDDGISFVIRNNKLEAIVLYSEGAYGFKQYQGQLPQGLTFSDTREAVERKLGKPTKVSDTTDGHVVTLYSQHKMSLSFFSDKKNDRTTKLYVMYLRGDY